MTVSLYFDEDSMSHGLVSSLRARGVDVLTALEANRIERSDESHLEYASEQGRALYSFNVSDFFSLHTEWLSSGQSHAGLILCGQQQFAIGEQLRRLLRLVSTLSANEMIDRVEFLSSWG